MGSQDREIMNHIKDNKDCIENVNGLSCKQGIRDTHSRVEGDNKVGNSDVFEHSTVEVF